LRKTFGTLGIWLIGAIVLLLIVPSQAWFHLFNATAQETASAAFSINPLEQSTGAKNDFSIIWITGTQYLSKSHPTYFDSLCRWIVRYSDTYNVKMVVHTGDIVDSGGDLSQWANANNSMGILLDNGIPYCWDAGNHDFSASSWIGNQFSAFNATLM
jgi:hypothetical protein